MGETGNELSRVQECHPGNIVVALPHVDLVRAELGRLYVPVRVEDKDARLGLALLRVNDLDQSPVIRRLRMIDASSPDLDLLLGELRRRFAAKYGGWIPSMGKNRVMHGVHGLEWVSGGGSGDPHPNKNGTRAYGSARSAMTATSAKATPAKATPVATAMATPVPPSGSPSDGGWPAGKALGAGRDARVGVLDTHIFAHPRLLGRFIAPADAMLRADTQEVYSAWAGHATFVAGLIVDRAPAAELEVRQVLHDAHATASVWDVARKMMAFAQTDIDVLNVSFGCYTADGQPPFALARAVELLAPDVVIVAAAGNHGNVTPTADTPLTPHTPIWPAAFDDVVAVGAHDGAGQVAAFTPKDAPWISLLAPGVNVTGDYLAGRVLLGTGDAASERVFDGTAVWSGTSFAAAYVSGVIAARTVPGRRSAQEARAELLRLAAGHSIEGVMPYSIQE